MQFTNRKKINTKGYILCFQSHDILDNAKIKG